MPLSHGYGVLVGTLTSHVRETPDNQGRWYHVHLHCAVAGSHYEAAIDVDSHQSTTGVQWKVVTASATELGPIPYGAEGWHVLTSASGTGALDHIRHRIAATWRLRWVGVKWRWLSRWRLHWLRRPVFIHRPWITGSYLEASVALESILAIGAKTLIWGEPFTSGLGVHNVHQNQGDPLGSPWSAENGIWQDGAVATLQSNGSYRVFMSKFSSQSAQTDNLGHPA